jgi:hypothetical protein
VTLQTVASLIDDAWVIIEDRNVFIIQATTVFKNGAKSDIGSTYLGSLGIRASIELRHPRSQGKYLHSFAI